MRLAKMLTAADVHEHVPQCVCTSKVYAHVSMLTSSSAALLYDLYTVSYVLRGSSRFRTDWTDLSHTHLMKIAELYCGDN
eukprot:8287-Heterococcus_DN1.PRE.1